MMLGLLLFLMVAVAVEGMTSAEGLQLWPGLRHRKPQAIPQQPIEPVLLQDLPVQQQQQQQQQQQPQKPPEVATMLGTAQQTLENLTSQAAFLRTRMVKA